MYWYNTIINNQLEENFEKDSADLKQKITISSYEKDSYLQLQKNIIDLAVIPSELIF